MVYGPTQSAVATAIADALADGLIPESAMESIVMLAQVTVRADALDRHQLFQNARQAMTQALQEAFAVEARDGV